MSRSDGRRRSCILGLGLLGPARSEVDTAQNEQRAQRKRAQNSVTVTAPGIGSFIHGLVFYVAANLLLVSKQRPVNWAQSTGHCGHLEVPDEPVLVVGSHPAVGRVAALPTSFKIGYLQLVQRISRQRLSLGFNIYLVEFCRVQPEDLCLVFLGDLLVAKLLTHLVADLETLEGVDTPLR